MPRFAKLFTQAQRAIIESLRMTMYREKRKNTI